MVKWRCCPELDQFHGFRSVEVLLETPPGSSKNCPEAKGGSVRVQISTSRPVSVFMIKPRLCPSRVQSSPVKLSLGDPKDCGLSRGDPKDCGLSRGDPKDCGLRVVDIKAKWYHWLADHVLVLLLVDRLMILVQSKFPLLEAKPWQEAKSNLVTVALGKDDRIAWCWTLAPPV
ncbi:hypothetical protein DY000_02020582 [Brassica cretica]|uniref:Uncharacterized protein n=1 Tax=Brassica cretica TaxID=69181 RepID=A0ABQ7E816_BRACR|nr:hypothetical protein DY000_02020582 [Brassica cretica]